MSAPRGKLTRKQELAIACLMTEPTHAAAVAAAGVSEATVQRWLRREDFQAAYRTARREVLDGTVRALQLAMGKAVRLLLDVVEKADAQDRDRVRAAVAVLTTARQYTDQADVLDRLRALEEKLAGQPGGNA